MADMETRGVELKPCPFCGEICATPRDNGRHFFMSCDACDADGPLAYSTAEAISAWNRRALPTPPEDTGHAILSNTKEGG